MSGAAWINIMALATSAFLALLGVVYFAMEDYYYKESAYPSLTTALVFGLLYVGDVVAYVVLLVLSIRMGPSSPHPLPVLFSLPAAGLGIIMVALDKLFDSQ